MRYEKKDRVIVKVYDKYLVGEITDKRKMKKGNLFNIILESGKEIECSRSNALSEFIINDKLTKILWENEGKQLRPESGQENEE